jgi:hypothetical protein
MSFKTTYVLFGVLVAELLLLGWLLSAKKTVDREDYVFPSMNDRTKPLRIDDIGSVEVEVLRDRDGKAVNDKLVFVRSGQEWRLDQPSVRVEGSMVIALIDSLIKARREENADVRDDLPAFGLEPPSGRVTLIKKEGDVRWVLTLGNESVGGVNAFVYVTSSDREAGKQVLAVRRDQFESFLKSARELSEADLAKMEEKPGPPLYKSANDYRSRTLLADSPIDVLAVDLQAPGQPHLALEKNMQDGHWRFTDPAAYGEADEGEPGPPGPEAKPGIGVRGLLDAVAALRVASSDDFRTNRATDAELAQRGLVDDKPKTLRIGVRRYLGGFLAPGDREQNPPISDDLLIGDKADAKGEKYYARLKKERYLVLVSAKDVQRILDILAKPEALRDHDLVRATPLSVDVVNVKVGDTLLKLKKVQGAWKLYEEGKDKPQNADAETIGALLQALTTKRLIKEFPKASDAEAGLDKPQAVIALWANGLDPKAIKPDVEPKPKDPDKPTVQLTFGKAYKVGDEDRVYVRRKAGADETLVSVPARPSPVVPLLEMVLQKRVAYLDAALPRFPFDKVRTIARIVRQDNKEQRVEVARDKNEEGQPTWTIKKPDDWAGQKVGRFTVEAMIIDTLLRLRPLKLVDEKISADKVKSNTEWGLREPAVQVTLTLETGENQTEDWVYQFGNRVPDKSPDRPRQGDGYYARLKAKAEDRGLVFVVGPDVVQQVKSELRDMTVVRFDPNKVMRLRVVGWQKQGKPTTVEFEREPGKPWAQKANVGPRLEFKTQKLNDVLLLLASLQATEFVPGGPKPAYGLDLKDRAVQIHIGAPGRPEAVVTFGAARGEEHYATSSQTKDVFLVRQDWIKLLREGPEYFAK